MRKTLGSIAFAVVTCAVAHAQVVQVSLHQGASDRWGPYFNVHKKLTFSGRVTGIEVTRPSAGVDEEVVLLVKNKAGGGTAVVELGPKWYVDQQEAKAHTYDNVQITGSKVMSQGQGIIIASQVLIDGQGGPVLALRRPNGSAYWMTNQKTATRVAANETSDADDGTTIEGPPPPAYFPPPVLQLNNGLVNIDTGYSPYYPYNSVYSVGNFTNVVTGPYPLTLTPNPYAFPSYMMFPGAYLYPFR